MAITVNHNQSGQNPSGTNTITVTSSTGNLLVLLVSTNAAADSVTSMHDNINANYTQVGTVQTSSTANAQIFYFPNAATGATTLTLVFNVNVEYSFQWFDLGGAVTSSPLETSTPLSNQGPVANPSGPSVAVTGTADFVCSVACTTTSFTAVSAPFTGAFPDPANTGSGFAFDNTSGAGTFSPSWTMASGTWGGITAAFTAAAAGGGSPIFMLGHT